VDTIRLNLQELQKIRELSSPNVSAPRAIGALKHVRAHEVVEAEEQSMHDEDADADGAVGSAAVSGSNSSSSSSNSSSNGRGGGGSSAQAEAPFFRRERIY
jgi:uncharacterized membrane protein YgcG